jgi:hypothetical protein
MDQLSHPLPCKRIRIVTSIPDELGKLIAHDSHSLDQDHDDNLVALFRHCQDRGDFTDLARIKHHHAYRILKTYGLQGAPVKLSSKPWTTAQNDAAIARGPHKSANEYVEFLRSEMAEMVKAAQWIVLPYSKIRGRPGSPGNSWRAGNQTYSGCKIVIFRMTIAKLAKCGGFCGRNSPNVDLWRIL